MRFSLTEYSYVVARYENAVLDFLAKIVSVLQCFVFEIISFSCKTPIQFVLVFFQHALEEMTIHVLEMVFVTVPETELDNVLAKKDFQESPVKYALLAIMARIAKVSLSLAHKAIFATNDNHDLPRGPWLPQPHGRVRARALAQRGTITMISS